MYVTYSATAYLTTPCALIPCAFPRPHFEPMQQTCGFCPNPKLEIVQHMPGSIHCAPIGLMS